MLEAYALHSAYYSRHTRATKPAQGDDVGDTAEGVKAGTLYLQCIHLFVDTYGDCHQKSDEQTALIAILLKDIEELRLREINRTRYDNRAFTLPDELLNITGVFERRVCRSQYASVYVPV